MNSLIIDFPWTETEFSTNGMYVSADQVKELFTILVKAFLYKLKHETYKKNGNFIDAKPFDLTNVRVFNQFLNAVMDNILDSGTREYALETLRTIRDNDFKKKSVRMSYNTLYKLLEVGTPKFEQIKDILAESHQFIDFCRLFKICNKTTLLDNSPEILETSSSINALIEMNALEQNLF